MPEETQNFLKILGQLKQGHFSNYDFIKDIAVSKDYYEFFGTLGDAPLKSGYEKLIAEILRLAGISNYAIQWKGSFDHKKTGHGNARLTLTRDSTSAQFKLDYNGESADTKNLLKGLNAFIKSCLPNEKRKFQSLQIYNDQTGCIWFITEGQWKELCPILHSQWQDFADHYCEVTLAEARKTKGQKGELKLCQRNAARELERLNNKKWKIYPAKNMKNRKIKSAVLLLILISATTLTVWKGINTYRITGCIDFFQQARPLFETMPRGVNFTASEIEYECSWNKKSFIVLIAACIIVGWRASKKWKKINQANR